MKRSSWRTMLLSVRLAWARQNALGCLGAGLLILAAAMYGGVKPWLQAQNEQLRADIHNNLAQQRLPVASQPALSPAALSARRARDFDQVLGDDAQFELNLSAILAYAKRAGLVLNEADYDRSENRQGRYIMQGVGVPFTGAYVDLRAFCQTALQRMPFAALDSIQLKRNTIAAEAVEARLHLTLYLRPADVGVAPRAAGQLDAATATPTPSVAELAAPLEPLRPMAAQHGTVVAPSRATADQP